MELEKQKEAEALDAFEMDLMSPRRWTDDDLKKLLQEEEVKSDKKKVRVALVLFVPSHMYAWALQNVWLRDPTR